MSTSLFSNGTSAENDDRPAKVPQLDYDSKSGESKLIITFFANDRPREGFDVSDSTKIDGQKNDPLLFEADFINLLSNLVAPEPLSLLSSKSLSRSVFQQVYTTASSFPKASTLRHDPFMTSFERANSLEIVFDLIPSCPPEPFRPLKLAVFDMDSTLIEEEVIDELARSIGITDQVSAITARAMNGEIAFEQSLRERLALLQGVKADVWEDLKDSIHIAQGAKMLCKALRERDIKMAVVSGGFVPMAEWLKEQLGLDYAYANHVCCFAIVSSLGTISCLTTPYSSPFPLRRPNIPTPTSPANPHQTTPSSPLNENGTYFSPSQPKTQSPCLKRSPSETARMIF